MADQADLLRPPGHLPNRVLHHLASTPQTTHWGFFDGSLPPVLRIASGDAVRFECVSGNPEWMPPPGLGYEVLPDLAAIHAAKGKGSGNHILTGPVFIEGAEPGDVLEVRILEIGLRQNWGYNLFRAYGGTLPAAFPYYRLIHIGLDEAAGEAVFPAGLRVPIRPFFGQMAVAPPAANGRQNSKEPRDFGGNIDCRAVLDRGWPCRTGRRRGQWHGDRDVAAWHVRIHGSERSRLAHAASGDTDPYHQLRP
jgi:acetamidase/formamidase